MKPAGNILKAPKIDPQRKQQIAQQARKATGSSVLLNAKQIRSGGCCGKGG